MLLCPHIIFCSESQSTANKNGDRLSKGIRWPVVPLCNSTLDSESASETTLTLNSNNKYLRTVATT